MNRTGKYEYKKLGDVATFINGYPFKPSDWGEKGIPIIRIQNLNNDKAAYNYYKGAIDSRYFVNYGDVLISWSGTLGVYEWDKKTSALLNQHIFKVIFDKIAIDKSYFKYSVSSRINEMKGKVHGITMQHITKGEFDKTSIPIPPIPEQEHIVAELDLLQGIIDKQKTQLKEYDTLAQSIFYDMFGSIDENDKKYDIKELEDVFSLITDGTHQTPEYIKDSQKGVKFLSAKDVVSGKINWSRIKYIPQELHKELYRRLAPQKGDILLCKNGTTGVCALVETEDVFDIYVSLALLRTEKEYNKHYLVFAINNPSTKRQFDDSLKGVGVQNLHLREIKKAKIIIPPLSLQQQFAAKIEAIEKHKTAINKSLEETQKLFDFTMDKYFG